MEGGSRARRIARGAKAEGAEPGQAKEAQEAHFCTPMLAHASIGPRVPPPLTGPAGDWLFEPKMDGLRCLAVRSGPKVTLCSRSNLSFNARFPFIVRALGELPVDDFVLDGEIVGLYQGKPDFAALQQGGADAIEYWLFDLPWLLGHDTRNLPIEQRKVLLEKTVPESDVLRIVQSLDGEPHDLFESMCRQGWEGLMAKRTGSVYRAGRSGDWYKLKCGCRQELVIGGFTAPGGSRTAFGALLLGYWRGEDLIYAGKVGTGFSEAVLKSLFAQLAAIERTSSPFATKVVEPGARWAEPELVAEVSFTNWTADGRLRHPSFAGLRHDKPSREVVREDCGARPGARSLIDQS